MRPRQSLLYVTGFSIEDRPQIGGVWNLCRKLGVSPWEMYQHCLRRGWDVDWVDALAAAWLDCSLHELKQLLETHFPPDYVATLMLRLSKALHFYGTTERLLACKRDADDSA